MKENVGDADQRIRTVVGSALVLSAIGPLGARRGSTLGLSALVGGVLLLESAITRTCPINEWLGLDTREHVGATPSSAVAR